MTEGPYKLPEGWRWVRLGEVCEVWDRLRKPVKKKERIPGETPYCGANGVIDYVSGYTHEGEFILLAEDGGFYGPGEPTAYIMQGRFWANNHVHIIRAIDGFLLNQLLRSYLVAADLRPFLTGATRPKLTQEAMISIPIPLPPLAEQRRIVARIEELMARVREARRLREQAKEEADRLWQSVLADAFPRPGSALPPGWRWVRLGEVCHHLRTSVDPRQYPDRDFCLYSIPAYDRGRCPEHVKGAEIGSAKLLVGKGACLFSKLNPRIPRAWVLQKLHCARMSVASTEFMSLKPHAEKLALDYLGIILVTETFLRQISNYVSGATGSRQRLNAQNVLSAVIPLPPLAEQRRIVAHLEAVREKIGALRAVQAEIDAALTQLEKSILDKAFQGELLPTASNEPSAWKVGGGV